MPSRRLNRAVLLGLVLAAPGAAAADATQPVPASAAAAESAPAAPVSATPRAPTRRKCTGWAAGATTETRDVVFRRDKLVQRATEEVEVTYQAWDVDDALDAGGADAACRVKTRGFCARYGATGERCRFQVHEGLENGGWAAATLVDAPPPKKRPPPKRPKGSTPPGSR